MVFKLIVVALLGSIVVSLCSGLFFMLRDQRGSRRTVRALTWRISLSLGLFALLMAAYAAGLIRPHGLYPAAPAAQSATYSQ